ncbi:hypothetical protein EJ08DRAFT_56334 [Tothia fuscella]|uniref:Uncharacterized protein n=1 Tax=Tothia fuscella TaxID=1048955 RepID=A0A9P4NYN4_9PEZI|nr:hypothetical protein EJ08DRAFT_56334 [Tothia fuscella]
MSGTNLPKYASAHAPIPTSQDLYKELPMDGAIDTIENYTPVPTLQKSYTALPMYATFEPTHTSQNPSTREGLSTDQVVVFSIVGFAVAVGVMMGIVAYIQRRRRRTNAAAAAAAADQEAAVPHQETLWRG